MFIKVKYIKYGDDIFYHELEKALFELKYLSTTNVKNVYLNIDNICCISNIKYSYNSDKRNAIAWFLINLNNGKSFFCFESEYENIVKSIDRILLK